MRTAVWALVWCPRSITSRTRADLNRLGRNAMTIATAKKASRTRKDSHEDLLPSSTEIASNFIPAAGTRFQRAAGIEDSPELFGADILRLWVAASDYSDDLRIGKNVLATFSETYRKLRNTIRWMLGNLAHFRPEDDRIEPAKMPELERLMLHRLAELDELVRKAYADFDYKRIFAALSHFMTTDLSAFYFDIRVFDVRLRIAQFGLSALQLFERAGL